ncbi:MAG: tyrosine-type recombinase/integrase [Clostridia bacterium]|nr:tyrosine-type recombinase/integrase [Clostridia bacterium]
MPLSQASFKCKWCELMLAAGCADWREVPEGTSRPGDILKQIKPRLTPHYFRHNYVTLLYESGVDPLIAMKIVGHTDYQTTANIYTHVRDEMLKKATVDLEGVFKKRAGKE